MLESLALSEASLRCTLNWAGDEYPCTGSYESDEDRLDSVGGGFKTVTEVFIKVRTEVFPSGTDVPRRGQTITYKKNASADPKTYRITKIKDYYGAIMELQCESPSKGA